MVPPISVDLYVPFAGGPASAGTLAERTKRPTITLFITPPPCLVVSTSARTSARWFHLASRSPVEAKSKNRLGTIERDGVVVGTTLMRLAIAALACGKSLVVHLNAGPVAPRNCARARVRVAPHRVPRNSTN